MDNNSHSKIHAVDSINQYNCKNSNKFSLPNQYLTNLLVYVCTIPTIENQSLEKCCIDYTKYSFNLGGIRISHPSPITLIILYIYLNIIWF